MATVAASNVLHLPWLGNRGFNDQWIWRQGEHVTLVGPTGVGKTSLEVAILPRRKFVLFLSTKRIDDTQDRLRHLGFKTISNVHELHPEVTPRAILRPPWPDNVSAKELLQLHSEVFREALMYVFRQGHWCVVMDEARYLTHDLGLSTEAQLLWLQGRSLKITVVAGTQRPRFIPLEAYDQATHLFFWNDPDFSNVARVAELTGVNRNEVLDIVPNLNRYEMLYSNRVTRELVITKLPQEKVK